MINNEIAKAILDEREQLIFGKDYDESNYRLGGICHFDNMSIITAKKLIEKGYMDPKETQNNSPTIAEFINFIENRINPDIWYIHGYAVSPKRDDCRISVTGIGTNSEISGEEIEDFVTEFRYADELLARRGTKVYCWYD